MISLYLEEMQEKAAAAKSKTVELGTMTLEHVEKYAEELKEAGHYIQRMYLRYCFHIMHVMRLYKKKTE